MIPIYIGWDEREQIAYATCVNSIIRHTKTPVSFTPLALHLLGAEYAETHTDGSNGFIYSRFLVPYFQSYEGWAIFLDGDMICLGDIAELWNMRDDRYAVMVAKHDYKTKRPIKYLGAKNEDYPRKNWSSVILWNCGHPANRTLTPEYVEKATGAMLHRFQHLYDDEIGEIPLEWNWLAEEYAHNYSAKLIHYTLGIPSFSEFSECDYSDEWFKEVHEAFSVRER